MDTIEKLCQELDSIQSSINSSGINNIDFGIIDKVEKISSAAEKLGMQTGKKLIDNLVTSLKSFQAGKSDENSVSVRITALEFYNKNVLNGKENDIADL